jgi:16S rRNA (guanine527-N7)-methyltransferase
MLLNKIVNHGLCFCLKLVVNTELQQFQQSLLSHQHAYDVEVSSEALARLETFYSLLTRWNDRLHLVAPCSPAEFATRHVLESLILIKHLPAGAKIADIGSGAGLPIIPCLITRPDLETTLIESSQKKAVFLREALNAVGRTASVIAKRFEEIEPPPVSFITCRALDQFMNKATELIDWAPRGATLLLFGGEGLRAKLPKAEQLLVPGSERRYLFVLHR